MPTIWIYFILFHYYYYYYYCYYYYYYYYCFNFKKTNFIEIVSVNISNKTLTTFIELLCMVSGMSLIVIKVIILIVKILTK